MKVIHLLSHSIPLKKDYILDGWPARLAKNIQKYSNKYEQECWFAVNNIKRPETWSNEGIKYRLFPAWTLNNLLESFCGIIISPTLTKALKNEANSRGIVFHIQGERSYLLWQMISIIKKCPIFLQFHGYYAPLFLVPLERILITPAERYYFQFVNYFFVSRVRINYLIKKCKVPSERIYHQGLGVDYKMFKPLDKVKIREELGLPIDKNIILYVGLFNRVKGVKKIVQAYQKIKKEYNTYLILIGGSKRDEYYNYCVKNADLVMERIPSALLPRYFNVADIYCMVCNRRKAKFGGIGIASIEALACNVPILNSSLAEAPKEIRNKIGFVVSSVDDLVQKMIYLIQHKQEYHNLHEITKPYFSWEVVVANTLNLYKKFE